MGGWMTSQNPNPDYADLKNVLIFLEALNQTIETFNERKLEITIPEEVKLGSHGYDLFALQIHQCRKANMPVPFGFSVMTFEEFKPSYIDDYISGIGGDLHEWNYEDLFELAGLKKATTLSEMLAAMSGDLWTRGVQFAKYLFNNPKIVWKDYDQRDDAYRELSMQDDIWAGYWFYLAITFTTLTHEDFNGWDT